MVSGGGEKVKCPICFELISLIDLKSAVVAPVKDCMEGQKVDLVLMKRAKV
jgi:hypothetical protein